MVKHNGVEEKDSDLFRLLNENPMIIGTDPCFETGIKTPFKQPIADNLSVIGCLVSFEYEYCYNNECIL